jgi:hypothetical protein
VSGAGEVSDELEVLLRPATAYRRLAKVGGTGGWSRPAMFALVCGCVASLATSGRVTLRLAGPATLYAALIPLVEIAVLRVLLRRGIAKASDLFFMGHAAWSLWLIAIGGIFAFVDPISAHRITGPPWGLTSLALVIAWSAYTDWCFFRVVSPGRAGRNLMVQRVACWSTGLAIFGGGSLWPGLRGILGI